MNRLIQGMARAVAETFDLPGPVLEIGSLQVPGQETLINLRGLFAGKPYLGVDMRPGAGVDLVANAEAMPLANGSVGTVLALNTFEHVARFWRAMAEVHRVLRPDGAVLLACPFHFHIHSYPSDYWRFTPQAMEVLLEDYADVIVGQQGPAGRPLHVWALGFREGHPAVTAEQWQAYQERLRLYAHEPLRPIKRLRYSIGRLLCGRRPFAPYLEQGRWTVSHCKARNTRAA